jgi:hypothetical protein
VPACASDLTIDFGSQAMTDIPAISGLVDASDARVMLFQSGRQVHAPMLGIGLQPLDATLTALAGLDATAGILRQTGADAFAKTTALFAGIKVTVFTANGTFTPDAKMLECEVWAWGGGGSGAGAAATAAGQASVGSGGHAGAKAYGRFTAAQIGASQAVATGGGGAGAAGANGAAGTATTLGALLSAAGGPSGLLQGAGAVTFSSGVNNPVQSATGTVRGWTTPGTIGTALSVITQGGQGACNELGGAGVGFRVATGAGGGAGAAGQANTGAGGGGAANGAGAAATAGGNGGSGLLIVKEYLSF